MTHLNFVLGGAGHLLLIEGTPVSDLPTVLNQDSVQCVESLPIVSSAFTGAVQIGPVLN